MDISGSAGRKKYLTKTTVNLAMRENKNGESRAAVPTAIVLAVLIALFCKFGVIDPLMKASASEQLVETESVSLQGLEDANADYDKVLANYESLNISTVSVTGTMNYRSADFYEKNGVKLMLGETAEKIDANDKTVVLKGGKTLTYDNLLVATGSRPFLPPMDGMS